jgi:hypothetical protein
MVWLKAVASAGRRARYSKTGVPCTFSKAVLPVRTEYTISSNEVRNQGLLIVRMVDRT